MSVTLEQKIERVTKLGDEILNAAEEGDWETVIDKESHRDALIRAWPSEVTVEQRQAMQEALTAALAVTSQVQELAKLARGTMKSKLLGVSRRQQVKDSYGTNRA